MSQLKQTTSSVCTTKPLKGQLDIWTIKSSFSSRRKSAFYVPWRELVRRSVTALIWKKGGNCVGNKAQENVAHIFIAPRANRNRLFQWQQSIHRAGLCWSVGGEEHTPAVSVRKEKKIAFIAEGRGLSGHSEAETESVIHFQINSHGKKKGMCRNSECYVTQPDLLMIPGRNLQMNRVEPQTTNPLNSWSPNQINSGCAPKTVNEILKAKPPWLFYITPG